MHWHEGIVYATSIWICIKLGFSRSRLDTFFTWRSFICADFFHFFFFFFFVFFSGAKNVQHGGRKSGSVSGAECGAEPHMSDPRRTTGTLERGYDFGAVFTQSSTCLFLAKKSGVYVVSKLYRSTQVSNAWRATYIIRWWDSWSNFGACLLSLSDYRLQSGKKKKKCLSWNLHVAIDLPVEIYRSRSRKKNLIHLTSDFKVSLIHLTSDSKIDLYYIYIDLYHWS